jgi:ATP/maltotriose-dependent transcriptional regulator MalT
VVLVEGRAGIGKTTMVQQFLEDAGSTRVLWASGDEGESRLPYAVLAQLLAELQNVAEPVARASIDTSGDPLMAGAQFLDQIGTLGDDESTVVVFDDAHWSHGPSLQASTFALRRLRSDRVLAIFVSRDDEPGLPEAVRRLAGERRLRIGGLDGRQLIELAVTLGVDGLSPQPAERLREHTGGNPLYARALLEELEHAVLRRPSGPLPAPRWFALLALGRLAACGADGRQLLEAAAHLAFCRGDGTGVVDALQSILTSTVWQQVDETGVVAWRELYAEALVTLDRLEEAENMLLQLEARAVPRGRISSLARAARVRGGLAAARNDPAAARRAFEDALEGVRQLAMPFERASVQEAYGRFLRRTGERRGTSDQLQAALATFTSLGASPFAERCRAELTAVACHAPTVRRRLMSS